MKERGRGRGRVRQDGSIKRRKEKGRQQSVGWKKRGKSNVTTGRETCTCAYTYVVQPCSSSLDLYNKEESNRGKNHPRKEQKMKRVD